MTTHISTFYSFKGGVGRTLLLANVGVSLARSGEKVLLWDLDVEAPGMHYISGLRQDPPQERGFLEWLLEWQRADSPQPEGDLLESFLSLPYAVLGTPGLFVMPAFGSRSNFASLYQQLDLNAFTTREPDVGLKLFQRLLEALSLKHGYDHVLLDSRTGITDLGGLLTAALPHATVLVGNYSAQNTVGLLSVYRALQKAVDDNLSVRRQGPLQRILVASPVPLHENVRSLTARRKAWDNQFERPLQETRVEVPYVPRLLFGEELLVETEPGSPVARAYDRVAEQLSELRKALVRKQESAELEAVLEIGLSASRPGGSRRGGPRVRSFVERVEQLLNLLGYDVSRGERDDLIAERKSGFKQERYLVRCKETRSPLSAAAVVDLTNALDSEVQELRGTDPMLVVSAFSPAARTHLQAWEGVARTLKELERELFDFKPYLAWLRRNYEESTLARSFVDSRFVPGPHEPSAMPSLERGKAWALGKGPRFWVVLGEQGTGKTSFVRRLAYELAASAEKGDDVPIPLYIPLRQLPGMVTLEALLQQHLSSTVGWRGDPAVLLHLLSLGRVVLLLDGLDELGAAAVSLTALEDQLRYLARPTALEPEGPQGNRVLLTARTALFRDPRSAGVSAADEKQASLTALGQAALTFGARMDELAGWNQEQIFRFLTRASGEERAGEWRALLGRLEEKAGLMTANPLLVEMLLYVAPELSMREGHLSLGALFWHFVERWCRQASRKDASAPAVQPELFEHLAREIRGRSKGRLPSQLLPLVRAVDGSLSAAEAERLLVELRASPFLIRAFPSGYQFASKSFEDFFFARYLLRAARERTLKQALDTPPLTPECVSFLADLVAMEGGGEVLEGELRDALADLYRPRVSENALGLAYEWSCAGAGKAGPESRERMSRLMPQRARLESADLRKSRLAFAWLEGACLVGALLDGADLTEANLKDVEGTGLTAQGSVLDGTDFSGAELLATDFSGSRAFARPPSFQHALLVDARLVGTAWQLPEMEGASLVSTDLGLARWIRPGGAGPERQEISLTSSFQGDVKCVAVSPDGALLVISAGWSPWVWDSVSGCPLMVLDGNQAEVGWVGFSPRGDRVGGGCRDGKVVLWEVSSGKMLRNLQAHEAPINELAFSPDGALLATASSDGTARLWDVETGSLLKTFEDNGKPVMAVDFSPDGTLLATGSGDAHISVWNLQTGQRIHSLSGHRDAVTWLAFHPQLPLRLVSGSRDGTLRIWVVDVETQLVHFDPIEGPILSMAFNGTHLAAITDQGKLTLWNAETGLPIRSTEIHEDNGAVAFVPGSAASIVSATSRSLSIEHADGSGAGALRISVPWVPATALLPDGNALIGCEDGTLWVWNTQTGDCSLAIQTGNPALVELAVSPDGMHVATAVLHGPVQLWSLETAELIGVVSSFERLSFLEFSPDGGFLAGVGEYGLVWELSVPRPQVTFALEGHAGDMDGVAFSPDGRWLATFDDEAVRLWSGGSGALERSLSGVPGRNVNCIAFSPDGRWLAGAGDDGKVYLWSLRAPRMNGPAGILGPSSGFRTYIYGMAFSPGGEWILTGSSDGSVHVWDFHEGKLFKQLVERGHPVRSVAFSRDGARAMTTGWNGTVKLWDTRKWEPVAELVKLPQGWATLAGPYAVVSSDADTDRVAVRAGSRLAPLSLFREVCIQPEKVKAALAGHPQEPLRMDLSLAERHTQAEP